MQKQPNGKVELFTDGSSVQPVIDPAQISRQICNGTACRIQVSASAAKVVQSLPNVKRMILWQSIVMPPMRTVPLSGLHHQLVVKLGSGMLSLRHPGQQSLHPCH